MFLKLHCAALALVATACFNPDYPAGQACSESLRCPDGQVCEPNGECLPPAPSTGGDPLIIPIIPGGLVVSGSTIVVGGRGDGGLKFFTVDADGKGTSQFASTDIDDYPSDFFMFVNGTDVLMLYHSKPDMWFTRVTMQGNVTVAPKKLFEFGEYGGWSGAALDSGYGIAWSSVTDSATDYAEIDGQGALTLAPRQLLAESSPVSFGLVDLRRTASGDELVVRSNGAPELLRLASDKTLASNNELGLTGYQGDTAMDGDQVLMALGDTYENLGNPLVLARIGADDSIIKKAIPLPSDGGVNYPDVAWTGTELGVAFTFDRYDDTAPELWFARFDSNLDPIGDPIMLANTHFVLRDVTWVPGRSAYAILGDREEDSALFLIPVSN